MKDDKPFAPFFVKALILHRIGQLHVSTPYFTVRRIMFKATVNWGFKGSRAQSFAGIDGQCPNVIITPGGAKIHPRAVRLAAMRYAVGIHYVNRRTYYQVQNGI